MGSVEKRRGAKWRETIRMLPNIVASYAGSVQSILNWVSLVIPQMKVLEYRQCKAMRFDENLCKTAVDQPFPRLPSLYRRSLLKWCASLGMSIVEDSAHHIPYLCWKFPTGINEKFGTAEGYIGLLDSWSNWTQNFTVAFITQLFSCSAVFSLFSFIFTLRQCFTEEINRS